MAAPAVVVVPADAPGAASAEPSTTLQEVVVTATKRAKSLREIPASITSIPGDELQQRNAQGVQDIVKLVPGVNFTDDGGGGSHITFRGISAQNATGLTSGTLFGDVSFTDEYVPLVVLDPNPFDLKDVEVLKGPQGTLYGASALNGAIRYVPEGPRFGRWQSKYFVQYTDIAGSWKPGYGGMVNIPLGGDELALRLVGFERTSPGYIDNTRTGTPDANRLNQAGARGILGWQPGDALDVSLTYAWQNTHTADKGIADNLDGQLTDTDSPRASPLRQNYDLVSLALRYDLGWAEAVSETAYVHKSAHNFFDSSNLVGNGAVPVLALVTDTHSGYLSQELRLASPNRRDAGWQWVAGVFASRELLVNNIDIPIGSPTLPLSTVAGLVNTLVPGLGALVFDNQLDLLGEHTNVVIKDLALFGDVTRRLGPVELDLGARVYRTLSGGDNLQTGLLPQTLEDSPQGHDISGAVNEAGVNPKASLLVHAGSHIIAYAAASRGYRPGGVQAGITLPLLDRVQAPNQFVGDTIWNYESGVRTSWLDNKVHVDLTGYYERWKNPQYLQPNSTNLATYITNVGGVRSYGAETAIQWLLPVKGLMLSSSGSYSRTTTMTPFTTSTGAIAPAGSAWPFAPHWQSATTLAYMVELASWNLNGGVTYSYLGKAANNLTQQAPVFNYEEWDAHLSIDSADRSWLPELTITANNLLDRRGVVNHEFQSLPDVPYSRVNYLPPRTISLRLSGQF